MVEELESTRHKWLRWLVTQLPGGDPRRSAFEYVDPQFSGQWVTALPSSPAYDIPSNELPSIAARYLGVPDPVCAELVGLSVAGKPISRHADSPLALLDAHGDVLSSVALGNAFKARHDAVKYALYGLAKWAHVGTDVEVFGLFRDVIPQPVLTKLEAGADPSQERRERDGLVPDFRFQGGYVGIAELKIT